MEEDLEGWVAGRPLKGFESMVSNLYIVFQYFNTCLTIPVCLTSILSLKVAFHFSSIAKMPTVFKALGGGEW